MRILIACDVLAPYTTGGAGRVARELGTAFADLGDDVHFLARDVPEACQDGTTSCLPHPARTWPGRVKRVFGDVVKRFSPDLIWAHQPLSVFLGLPRESPPALFYTFHSSWQEEVQLKHSPLPRLVRKMAGPLLSHIERSVIERSQTVVVLSEFSRTELLRLYGRASATIPGGVNSRQFKAKKAASSGRAGPVRLITLRNLVPRMGLSQLIEAMAELPDHVHLDIGGDGPLRTWLRSRIQSLKLGDRVRLLGHVSDNQLESFYHSGDWFILPTLALEGFGLVILESLCCGTPVLGTRVGAIPELLSRMDPNWLIEAPTAPAIASKIMQALEWRLPDPRALHGAVASEYDWSLIAARYQELFAQAQRG